MEVALYGPSLEKPLKSSYGGGAGGYVTNVRTLLDNFESEDIQLELYPHSFRGLLRHDNFIYRFLYDSWTFLISILKRKPKVIHVLAQYRSALPREVVILAISQVFGLKTIYDIKAGAFEDAYNSRSLIYRLLVKVTISLSDCIISEGKACQAFVQHEFGRKSMHLPNVVSDDAFAGRLSKIMEDSVLRVLFVGYLMEDKGVYELLAACKKVHEEGILVELTLIGEGSEDFKAWLKSNRQSLKFPMHLEGRLQREKVLGQMRAHDIYCYPSRHYGEGHNNTVNEAMASEMYLVTSNQGFLDEVVDSNVGVCLEQTSVDTIATELMFAQQNKVVAREKAAAAKKKAFTEYRVSQAVEELESLYLKLVTTKENTPRS